MKSLLRILFALLILLPILSAAIGWYAGPAALRPPRRPLTSSLIQEADATFARLGAKRQEFDIRTKDSVLLHGWKVRAAEPRGDWVLLFHGVADNRIGMLGQAAVLLSSGYSVVMMDARAHGASEGELTTYGWLERDDARAVVDALEESEKVRHLFAFGESMGAVIALQSAAVEPRIEAVVAEAPFASLREASYDYAGLQRFPWLGKTLFRAGAWTMIHRGEAEARFPPDAVSPENSVAARAFPVLLICDAEDATLPCRHSERIYAAARGPKQLWRVPRAFHTAAIGFAPEEFRDRVLAFFNSVAGY